MKKILIGIGVLFVIGLFAPSTFEKEESIDIDYEVLEKMEHLSKKINKSEGFYFASILVDRNSITDLNSFKEKAVKIANKENAGVISFYLEKRCFLMNNGKEDWEDEVMNSCFVGSIDASKMGTDWKEKLKPSDFTMYEGFQQ